MKVVILAGGLGARLAEETTVRPKPMVEIGEHPMLWHIMKSYSRCGFRDFIICLGYKGYLIKEYFANYRLHRGDVTFDLSEGSAQYHRSEVEPWKVTLVDTGEATMTGGRLKRIERYLSREEPFFMTYGDGVADIDFRRQLVFHTEHGRDATITAVRPPGRFGALSLEQDRVTRFLEKPLGDGGYINGGFFVLSPRVVSLIDGDGCVWEQGPLETLAASQELVAFRHEGFWQCMDTMRDRLHLEDLWAQGRAPWKTW